MKVILKHDLNRIKNGFSARSSEVGLTAHGATEDLARRNLEKTLQLFFAPFARNNCLLEEIKRAGLTAEDAENQKDVTILLV